MTIVPQKSDDTVHILEGRATLFKRPLTPHWHVRYKANGKWERTTTKCEELAEAKSKAVDIVTNAWFADGRQGNETQLRQVLRDYILILAHTGIRPGTEAMNLKWHSVGHFTKKGVQYLGITVNGKTGPRHVTVRHGAIRYFDRLRCMNEEWAKLSLEDFLKLRVDTHVFRVEGKDRKGNVVQKDMTTTFGRMFPRLLTRANMLNDKETGKARTLYSLRHMYATFALTYNRMSVYTLSEHMGTSVKMIEDHYGQLLLRDKAAEIAGDKEWFLNKAKRSAEKAPKSV